MPVNNAKYPARQTGHFGISANSAPGTSQAIVSHKRLRQDLGGDVCGF